MYVKYIMAGFLIIFAVSMMIQFVSYLLFNVAQLCDRSDHEEHETYQQLIAASRE